MNEAPHVTDTLLDRLAQRDLRGEEILALEEHLAACDACAQRARDRATAARAQLHRFFAADAPAPLEHPDRASLRRYARRRLSADASELVAGHLDECADCAGIVDGIRAQHGNPWRWMWLTAAVAAMLVIVFLIAFPRRRAGFPTSPRMAQKTRPVTPPSREPQPERVTSHGDPRWDEFVRDAIARKRVPVPAFVAELRGPEDIVRGTTGDAERVSPAGRVIDSARPSFSWRARSGATYTVFVFDGDRQIARSAALHAPRWTSHADLPRGRTLTWQVEAAHGDAIETIPSPPAPAARFRITSVEEHDDLARALAARQNDSVLLSVLYARAGMIDEARTALARAADADPTARMLLESLPKD